MKLIKNKKQEKVKIYETQKARIQRIQQQIMIMNRVMTACSMRQRRIQIADKIQSRSLYDAN